MRSKQHSIQHRMGVYCKKFALGFVLICAQLTLSSASAQTSEPAAETFQDTKALIEQADSAYKKGDFQQAIRDFTQVIALKPNESAAYALRAHAYNRLKDYSSAIRDFTQAIFLNPNYAEAYNNRAWSLALKNDYRSATRDARKACSLGECKMLEWLGNNGGLRD